MSGTLSGSLVPLSHARLTVWTGTVPSLQAPLLRVKSHRGVKSEAGQTEPY